MAYMLRVRPDDNSSWGEPAAYESKRDRDKEVTIARTVYGMRTHSWTETKAEQKARLGVHPGEEWKASECRSHFCSVSPLPHKRSGSCPGQPTPTWTGMAYPGSTPEEV